MFFFWLGPRSKEHGNETFSPNQALRALHFSHIYFQICFARQGIPLEICFAKQRLALFLKISTSKKWSDAKVIGRLIFLFNSTVTLHPSFFQRFRKLDYINWIFFFIILFSISKNIDSKSFPKKNNSLKKYLDQ